MCVPYAQYSYVKIELFHQFIVVYNEKYSLFSLLNEFNNINIVEFVLISIAIFPLTNSASNNKCGAYGDFSYI